MRAIGLILLILSAVVLPARADDEKTYVIKLKPEMAGDRTKVTKSDVSKNTASIEVMGQKNDNTEKKTTKFSYTEELLERDVKARVSTKLKRTYTQAEKTVDGEKTEFSYAKQTVLIKRIDGKFTFTVNGDELDDDEAKDLDEEFNKKDEVPLHDEDLLPKKPVKIGESWVVDTAMVVKSFESVVPFTLDVDKSKIVGKLLKVYPKDDKQFGTIEMKVTLVVKEFKLDGQEIEMKPGSTMVITSIIDQCIDGTSHAQEEKSSIKMDLTGEIPNGTLKIGATAKLTKTIEDIGKK